MVVKTNPEEVVKMVENDLKKKKTTKIIILQMINPAKQRKSIENKIQASLKDLDEAPAEKKAELAARLAALNRKLDEIPSRPKVLKQMLNSEEIKKMLKDKGYNVETETSDEQKTVRYEKGAVKSVTTNYITTTNLVISKPESMMKKKMSAYQYMKHFDDDDED